MCCLAVFVLFALVFSLSAQAKEVKYSIVGEGRVKLFPIAKNVQSASWTPYSKFPLKVHGDGWAQVDFRVYYDLGGLGGDYGLQADIRLQTFGGAAFYTGKDIEFQLNRATISYLGQNGDFRSGLSYKKSLGCWRDFTLDELSIINLSGKRDPAGVAAITILPPGLCVTVDVPESTSSEVAASRSSNSGSVSNSSTQTSWANQKLNKMRERVKQANKEKQRVQQQNEQAQAALEKERIQQANLQASRLREQQKQASIARRGHEERQAQKRREYEAQQARENERRRQQNIQNALIIANNAKNTTKAIDQAAVGVSGIVTGICGDLQRDAERRDERVAQERMGQQKGQRSMTNVSSDGHMFTLYGQDWQIGELGINWYDTQKWIKNLGEGWRAPTLDELKQLYLNVGRGTPIKNNYVWSGKLSKYGRFYQAWQYSFYHGHHFEVNPKERRGMLKPVAVAVRDARDRPVYSSVSKEEFDNRWNKLRKGLTKEEVFSMLGRPSYKGDGYINYNEHSIRFFENKVECWQ